MFMRRRERERDDQRSQRAKKGKKGCEAGDLLGSPATVDGATVVREEGADLIARHSRQALEHGQEGGG